MESRHRQICLIGLAPVPVSRPGVPGCRPVPVPVPVPSRPGVPGSSSAL
jgi:hypothetical protein